MPYKDREQQLAAQRKHYVDNREVYRERTKQSRRETSARVNAIKEASPCKDCGFKYPYYVMQFDHIEDNKVESVHHLVRKRTWAAVEAEIAKCELVCANCHAERTHSRLPR